MASFNRTDYQEVYSFARDVFHRAESMDLDMERAAALIMQKCEGVIGQQSDFPETAREVLE